MHAIYLSLIIQTLYVTLMTSQITTLLMPFLMMLGDLLLVFYFKGWHIQI